MKKLIALLLCTCLAVTALAGCGGDTSTSNEQTNSTSSSGTTDLTPVTFKMYCDKPVMNYEDYKSPVAEELKRKTGVTLELTFPTGSYKQKVGVMVASGDYPEIMSLEADSVPSFMKVNALVPWDSYLDKYGSNIKAFYGDKLKRLQYSKEDKQIYALNGNIVNEKPAGYAWDFAFAVQFAVLKDQGYPKLQSLQDLEKVLKAYKGKYPQIDGKETIGFTAPTADGWRWKIGLTNPAFLSAGLPDNGEFFVDEKERTIQYHYRLPGDREYFRWLNRINDMGLLDKELFTHTYGQYISKLSAGRALSVFDGRWQHQDAEAKLKADGKLDRRLMPFPIVQDPATQKYQINVTDGGCGGVSGVVISKKCSSPERAVQFFDYLLSEEGQILTSWGIEGKHYDIVDGKRVRKPDLVEKDKKDPVALSKETGMNVYCVFPTFPHYGNGKLDSKGQSISYVDEETAIASFTDIEKEALKAYGYKSFVDAFPKESEIMPGGRKYGNALTLPVEKNKDIKVISQKITDSVLKAIAKCVLAKPADFDKEYNAFIANMDALGAKKVEEEATKLLRERMELWS